MDINGDVNKLDLDTDVVLIVNTVPIIMKNLPRLGIITQMGKFKVFSLMVLPEWVEGEHTKKS